MGRREKGRRGVDLLSRLIHRMVKPKVRRGGDIQIAPPHGPSPEVGLADRIVARDQGQHGRVHIGCQALEAGIGQAGRHRSNAPGAP